MTRKWTYYLTTAKDAAAVVDNPDCRTWSAAWKPGLDKDATLVIVAADASMVKPNGTPLGSVELSADKDPWPPPPPPPPATSVGAFSDALVTALGVAAPRSID